MNIATRSPPVWPQLYDERVRRQLALDTGGALPTVAARSAAATGDWTVAPLPAGLRNRKIDLGDVTPSDLSQLTAALNSTASGVQVTVDRSHSQMEPRAEWSGGGGAGRVAATSWGGGPPPDGGLLRAGNTEVLESACETCPLT